MLTVHRVCHAYPDHQIGDVAAAVEREVEKIGAAHGIRAGMRIALTAGSRGIANIDTVLASAVRTLQRHGARPFLIPAMGSHGGANDDGQKALLAGYGITEATMGVPIDARMDTVLMSESGGVKIHTSVGAAEADGVLVVARVKPHTGFVGDIESGMLKMLAVGLGKRDGAAEIHSHEKTLGMQATIRIVAGQLLAANRVWGALGLVENAHHKLAMIEGFVPRDIIAGDERLLRHAKAFMPQLPFGDIDVVWCQWMGKDVSGSGVDPNIVGRHATGYRIRDLPRKGMPIVRRLLISDLTSASRGNAVGIGYAEGTTTRLVKKIDLPISTTNAATSGALDLVKVPRRYTSDEEMLAAMFGECGRNAKTIRAVFIQSTLQLGVFWASPAILADAGLPPEVTVDPNGIELPCDANGMIELTF